MSTESPGVIEPGSLYLVDEVRRRLKLGDWAWRKMRRAGLPIVRQGKRAYVFGDDLLAFFATVGKQQDPDGAEEANNG